MSELKIGQKDPYFGITIKMIAFTSDDVCVFLDKNFEIYYSANDSAICCDRFNEIHSKIRRLEVLVIDCFSKKGKSNYNFLLAELLASSFDGGKADDILSQLSNIEKDIYEIADNRLKNVFFFGSSFSGFLICLSIFFLYINKKEVIDYFNLTSYQVVFSSLFGGVGALIFNFSKLKNYRPSRVIHRNYVLFEGVSRILYGCLFGLIITIGIKAGFVFSTIAETAANFQFAFIALVAGASDTFIKAIVKTVEENNSNQ